MPKQPVSVAQRQAEFSEQTYVSQGKLFCQVCKCQLAYDRVASIKKHFSSNKHQEIIKIRAETGLKQPTIIEAVAEIRRVNESRSTHLMELTEAMVTANIPLTKLEQPLLKSYLEKNITELGLIPSAQQMRRYYLPAVFRAHKKLLKEILTECMCATVVADEPTDFLSRKILSIMLIYFKAPTTEKDSANVMLLDCVHLHEVNYKTVSEAIMQVLKKQYDFDFKKVNAFVSDNATYMTKAFNQVLQIAFPHAQHITCTAHIYDLGVQNYISCLPAANQFIASFKMIFSGQSSDRKMRFKAYLAENGKPQRLASEPNTNRWNSWLKAALYHAEFMPLYNDFFTQEQTTHPQSVCLKKIVEMLNDKSLADLFIDIDLTGKYLIQCLTKNEGLKPDAASQIDDVKNMLFWCRKAVADMKTDAGKQAIAAYADAVEAYYYSDNRFKQPGSKFMQAVRALDPNILSTYNVDMQLLFDNCKRFDGEEIKFRVELNQYYDGVKKKTLVIIPGEHPIDFWDQNRVHFPVLAPAAIFCLSISANSVTVERSFSQGRDVLTKKRNRLAVSNLALHHMLYQNIKAVSAYERKNDEADDEDSVIFDD